VGVEVRVPGRDDELLAAVRDVMADADEAPPVAVLSRRPIVLGYDPAAASTAPAERPGGYDPAGPT
jgi:hypothetical protein